MVARCSIVLFKQRVKPLIRGIHHGMAVEEAVFR